MWFYLLGITIVPYIGYKSLIYYHNKRLIEVLKQLGSNEGAMKNELVQKKIRDVIALMYVD